MKIFFLLCFTALIYCSKAQNKEEFAKSFIASIKQNNYTILQKHIPTIAVLQKIAPKEFVGDKVKATYKYNQLINNLKASWALLIAESKANKVDVGAIIINEILLTNMPNNKAMQTFSIHCAITNKSQSLSQLIVTTVNNKLYLVSIPNPTSFFTSKDAKTIEDEITLLKGSNDKQVMLGVKASFDSLQQFTKANDINAFAQKCIYRGNDENRKWKQPVNIKNTNEVMATQSTFEKAKDIFAKCATATFKGLKLDKESEGIWYVYTVNCNEKEIHFAFLKVDNNYYLGDIDQ
jgi:hypothetical protein